MKWLCSYSCYEACYDAPINRRNPDFSSMYRLCDCVRLYFQIRALQAIGAIIHNPADPSNVYYDDAVLKRVLEKLGISEKDFWQDPLTTVTLIKGV